MKSTVQPSPIQTILEQLESDGIEVEYSCREGYCGACRCKLLAGEIEYIAAPLACIQDGEFLPCCTVALTEIEIDVGL